MSDTSTLQWIGPLHRAANDFLEVLVSEFKVLRNEEDNGFSMSLEFGPDTMAVWHRRGNDEVREKVMTNFSEQRRKIAAELESFFFENLGKDYHFNAPGFPFRFCSGGALPIVTLGGNRYYRLHWRDIRPVGWNITNGGSDSVAEMLDPVRIIHRELYEELVVFDFSTGDPRRLVIGGEGMATDAFPSQAWRMWQARLLARGTDLPALRNEPLPAGWLHGPDDLAVQYNGPGSSGYRQECSKGLFLNINAEDFGIEVDRAVSIALPETAVICDGELLSDTLLNSPIGLFEVGKLHADISKGAVDFRPSILFHDARRHDPAKLDTVVKAFLQEKKRNGLWPDIERQQLEDAGEDRFDLCPASRNIIRRCMGLTYRGPVPQDKVDVFLSFASEDQDLAQDIRDWLVENGRNPVFFSPESIRESDFTNQIFTALEQANNLVVVGTRIDHLLKNWVNYEYTSFFRKKMREQGSTRQIVTVLSDLPKGASPPAPLSDYQILSCTGDSLRQQLRDLLRFLS
jgi:hypothetical protein